MPNDDTIKLLKECDAGAKTVSYTHLDVYKRQSLLYIIFKFYYCQCLYF